MKKMLLSMTAMLMVMGSQAQAGELIWLSNVDAEAVIDGGTGLVDAATGGNAEDGVVSVDLQIADSFVYKLYNDNAAGGVESVDTAVLSLGTIQSGIPQMANAADCGSLFGADFKLASMTLGAVAPTCKQEVDSATGRKAISMQIPLRDSVEVSGEQGLDVKLATAGSNIAGTQSFKLFEIRSGAPDADGSVATGAAPADMDEQRGTASRDMHLDITAVLVSGGSDIAYSSYSGRLLIDLIVD